MKNTTAARVESIRSFWDNAAKENPYWYVSSYGAYGATRDVSEFWKSGERIWTELKSATRCGGNAGRVVEIGCGVGRLTRAIAPEAAFVDAFDISENMLNHAKGLALANVRFHLATGATLDLPDRCADLILAYCVFQHLQSVEMLEQYIGEMARVAKKGGTIAFTLTPRDLSCYVLPILRLRAYLREKLFPSGPKGVYRREWVGIRPSVATVRSISPIPLQSISLTGGRLLFFGVV